MIALEGDQLTFRFPEVHEDAGCSIHFQRTLRIPDDGKDYSLPPGLGRFPLRHLDDYARRLPGEWLRRGGVIMPMHQAEAMWICFGSRRWRGEGYPFAVKIATGKVCAVTGDKWVNHLNSGPQDYVVLPEQPWLDGYCVEKGVIRQFVAMPLGEGYSVEEQISGAAAHGGVQIVVYPMKAERHEELKKSRLEEQARLEDRHAVYSLSEESMGLAPGGRMKQDIYDDPFGLDTWDQGHASRCFVTIANSAQWMAMTGERPPTASPSAKDYTDAGMPWFSYYGGDAEAVAGAGKFKSLVSVAAMGEQKGETPLPENKSLDVERIIALRAAGASEVREMPAV